MDDIDISLKECCRGLYVYYLYTWIYIYIYIYIYICYKYIYIERVKHELRDWGV